jgi:hypothetical protein
VFNRRHARDGEREGESEDDDVWTYVSFNDLDKRCENLVPLLALHCFQNLFTQVLSMISSFYKKLCKTFYLFINFLNVDGFLDFWRICGGSFCYLALLVSMQYKTCVLNYSSLLSC